MALGKRRLESRQQARDSGANKFVRIKQQLRGRIRNCVALQAGQRFDGFEARPGVRAFVGDANEGVGERRQANGGIGFRSEAIEGPTGHRFVPGISEWEKFSQNIGAGKSILMRPLVIATTGGTEVIELLDGIELVCDCFVVKQRMQVAPDRVARGKTTQAMGVQRAKYAVAV